MVRPLPSALISRMARTGPQVRLAATLAIGQAAGRGALAIALLILVRHLTQEQFGDLALALAVVGILMTVADAGFGRLIVRNVARSDREPMAVVFELLRVRLAALVVVVVGAGAALAVLPTPLSGPVAGLAVAYLIGEALAFGFESASVGAERPWRFVVAQSGAALVLLTGTIVLAWTGLATLNYALAVLAGASAVKVCTHLVLWRSRSPTVRASISGSRVIGLYREALPFLGLTLLATVYYRIGVITLHAVQGARETASYAAALRVVDAVAIVAAVTFSAMSPSLSRAHRDSPGSIWIVWRRATGKCAAVVCPLAVLGAIAAPTLARVLFGGEYEQTAGEDLRLLMPGIALMVLQAFSAAVVFMADDHRNVLRLTTFNVAICVLASIGLSSAFGSAGAAMALSIAELISFVSFAWLIRRRYSDGTQQGDPVAQPSRRDPCT